MPDVGARRLPAMDRRALSLSVTSNHRALHRTKMQSMIFRFRTVGRDHEAGNQSCPGCESVSRPTYPRPHREYGTSCLGLVHVETLAETEREPSKTIYSCDVCNVNLEPIAIPPIRDVSQGALQETLSKLCQRADSEQDFEKLLELAAEIQRRLERRRPN